MTLEYDSNYKEALILAGIYHDKTEGLTKYEGASGSDKVYPKVLNIQTILLIKMFRKIDLLDERIEKLERKLGATATSSELDQLENLFKGMSLEKGKDTVNVKKGKWKNW